MELKPIHDETSYQAALAEVGLLLNAPDGSPEADRLEVLSLLIESYEQVHYPIAAPYPIAFIDTSWKTEN